MTDIALRQVACTARDLDVEVGRLSEVFGCAVAHVDPGIAQFGLEHAVLGFGASQFFEIVSPTVDRAPAARYLGGRDSRGYMLIFQAAVADRAAIRERARDRGYREIFTHDEDGYSCLQWHPADIGPTMLEVDQHVDDDLAGPWWPAGNAVGDGGGSRVERIVAARVHSAAPERDAAQWADLLRLPADERDDGWALPIAGGEVVFALGPDGADDGLVEITVVPRDGAGIRSAAAAAGLLSDDGAVLAAGIRVRLTG